MKKVIIVISFLLFSFSLIACKKDEDPIYLDNSLFTNALYEYVEEVVDNEYLINYIDNNYSNLKLTQEIFDTTLDEAKEALFQLEIARLKTISEVADDFFSDIININDLYYYFMLHYGEFINLSYNFNLNCVGEDYRLALDENTNYIMYNKDFVKVSSVFLVNDALINSLVDEDSSYVLYAFSQDNNYKITFNEVSSIPYIYNSNIYFDSSEDVIVVIEALEGEVSISEKNIASSGYELVEQKMVIDKEYLNDLFTGDRETFVFSISIYLDNTYYLYLVQIEKRPNGI